MATADKIEEQTLLRYPQRQYYPIRLQQRLKDDRYTILAKLGYGAYSTVWLARDERTNMYASVKVFVRDDTTTPQVLNEIQTLKHLAGCSLEHSGSGIARLADDIFQIDGPAGQHYCTASNPQGCNLWDLRLTFPDGRLPKVLVVAAVRCLVGCINWLALDCDLIHTEITSRNVLTAVANDDQFVEIERAEELNPSVPVMDGTYPVYRSREEPATARNITGIVHLNDFGSARSASASYQDWWMPDLYRAPEILMRVPWDFGVETWSIGILILELLEGRNLFYPIDEEHNQYVLPVALAQYISVLGHPPLWMIQESTDPTIPTLFDSQGKTHMSCWICEIPIPAFSLEHFVTAIPPGTEKDKFLDYMRRILVWDGKQRATSSDLFHHEWPQMYESQT
ncbi:hypothetical protein LTR91_014571 [Friedmanniomyces endolithicus]|uniref:Protein kinase domain-containing protein n=1 Tax=Friedmanniomyces endolithicus TaxID=329885 RepID=A0AAN6J8E1_9PEZI|nr:hypothetical protein LTR35_016127 [Friedmanniomyces endolithicus]KAK0303624.1 hypothetical protein LTR01_007957 [Friedmanniomyces endolithicus]KAK0313190.1 hypothetical protein LTR82_013621 [Friedmanniomyces endolithicus]KAK0911060.1 hypothetical protein LTR57_015595 [Friedmanniomyces endolithicus]KAK0970145.1 hypothetical protein LTS01_015963 [Friedmanniomyces endolithicus]